MYKQVLIPDKKNNQIRMPKEFFGKKVEVIIMEIGEPVTKENPILPTGKKININEFFEDFGANSNFPSIDEIRNKAWPSKW
jgi:hypothetical protein